MSGRAWLREPLLHFLLLGAALFVIFERVGGDAARSPDEIVVSADRIEQLAEGFGRTWQRPPTQAELAGLIDDFVVEEILYREALALRLDRDDTIVRRRLRQKMEFLAQDGAAAPEPNEAELDAFLRDHPEKFREEPRLSFEQIYLSKERRGARAEPDARALLAALNGADPPEPGAVGDPLPLPQLVDDRTPSEIDREFGGELAARVSQAPVARWAGPFASAFGLHVVRVGSRSEERVPGLAEVRAEVQAEWRLAEQQRAFARHIARLREGYRITIERPAERRAAR